MWSGHLQARRHFRLNGSTTFTWRTRFWWCASRPVCSHQQTRPFTTITNSCCFSQTRQRCDGTEQPGLSAASDCRQVPHCHLSVFPPRRILFLGALPYFRSTLLLNTFKGKNYRKCLSSGQQPILESTMRKFFLINCIFCAKEFFCEISCNEK